MQNNYCSELNQDFLAMLFINEPELDKTNKMTCASNQDSDQPGRMGHFVGFVILPEIISVIR